MAVYKRTYHGYDGPLTGERWRFLVLPRYAIEEMRKNKRLFNFFMFAMGWPVIAMFFIYINHNLSLLKMLRLDQKQLLEIDARFFLIFLGIQSMLSFFIAAFGGPSLIAPDLANNAVPLYLARPFSRLEYVLGKGSVLLILLSLMTWVPGLILFSLEGSFSGFSWMWANSGVATGIFFGSWVWIMVLTCQALAYSAWVRMKHLGSAAIFIVFFGSSAFSKVTNNVLHTHWGSLMDISHLVGSIWLSLFGEELRRGSGAVFFSVGNEGATPVWTCWMALAVLCSVCLYMLSKKIRGAEVVQ
jgi:ABC-2 type transport system permease protein